MELNLRKAGDSGPEVLILHGLMGSSRNWQRIIRKLSRDFRVTAPDLRNHGASPHGPHTIPFMRDDIIELIENSFDEPPHLIGHSMGGQVAMAVAMSGLEIKSLTLADSSPVRLRGGLQKILEALCSLDVSSAASRTEAEDALSSDIPDKRIRQFLLQSLRRSDKGALEWQCNLPELVRYVSEETFSMPEGAIYGGPTLVLAGGKSEYRVWEHEEAFRSHFPNMELEIFEDSGHWLHADAAERFTERVRSFINSNS